MPYITFVQSICDMNNEFFKPFLNTLLFNIATIVALVVGVVSYTVRAYRVWYANGGKQDLINVGCKVMAFLNKLSEKAYYTLEDAEVA